MSLTTPFASVTTGSRAVMVRSLAPSGWPPVGRMDRTRRPRCSRVPSGPGWATHCRTRSGRSRRSWIGSSSPNETETWPTSPMRSAKDGARIGTGLRAIRPCFQDDHGIAAVGHDEVQTIEREVWGYQRTVNLGCAVTLSTGAMTGLRDGLGRCSLTRGDDPIDVNRGDARGLPSANDYTRSRHGCNVRC